MTGAAHNELIEENDSISTILPRVLLVVLCITIAAAWAVGLALVLA